LRPKSTPGRSNVGEALRRLFSGAGPKYTVCFFGATRKAHLVGDTARRCIRTAMPVRVGEARACQRYLWPLWPLRLVLALPRGFVGVFSLLRPPELARTVDGRRCADDAAFLSLRKVVNQFACICNCICTRYHVFERVLLGRIC